MKLSQVLQSLFLGLILLGMFAIMAQNSYGFTLMGVSCFGLALLYFTQVGWRVIEDFSSLDKEDIPGISELLVLAFLIMLFGFRAFYVNLPSGDIIFMILCALLTGIYSYVASRIYSETIKVNTSLARGVTFFFSSVIFFLVAMGSRIILPSLSAVLGAVAVLASLPVFVSFLLKKKYEYSGTTITLFQFIVRYGNKTGMLFLFFIFSTFYVGLSTFRIIPAIENTDKPATYIELVTQAESGKEKPVNGKYKHEIYKEAMDKFLARHANNK
jgi:hypothetical protein